MTADPAGAGAAAALLEELAGLVRLAARRSDLVVREGKPSSTWSFDWRQGVILVDPVDLRSLAPDLCRGLALHEAAHAAVTVLQDILLPGELGRLMPLLNAIEDIRIEVWMRSRFPGAVSWIRAYNDLFYGLVRGAELPRSRQMQFLRGILEAWWYGRPTDGMRAEVTAALAACREPLAAAAACQPPDDADPVGVRSAQRAMWETVQRRIVPTWQRLVLLDRRDGLGDVAERERRELGRCAAPCAAAAGPIRRTLRRRSRRGPASAAAAAPASPPGLGPTPAEDDAYIAAWRRIARVSDRLGDELLRWLVPARRLRWTSGHPSGPRLDLRQVVRFEADRSLAGSLWSRPILPERRDPAVLLLVDRSGSMGSGERMARAFEGLVLLVEVCRRIGVPAAVWSFATDCREDLDWDAPLDAATRRRLGNLPGSCDGTTRMAPALDAVRAALGRRRGDPKLLFVLGDGEPDDPPATAVAVRRLEADGVATIGLGLGADTAGLANHFPRAVTEIPPERLVDHLGRLLESALETALAADPAARESGLKRGPAAAVGTVA